MADNLDKIEKALQDVSDKAGKIKDYAFEAANDIMDATSSVSKKNQEMLNLINQINSQIKSSSHPSSSTIDWSKFEGGLTAATNSIAITGNIVVTSINNLSTTITQAINSLNQIQTHINNQSSPSQVQNSGGDGGPSNVNNKKGFESIHSVLEKILAVATEIRDARMGQDDKDIKSVIDLEMKNRKTDALYVQALQKDPDDFKKMLKEIKHKKAEDIEDERARAYKFKQNEEKNKDNNKTKRGEEIAETIVGAIKGVMSTERITTGKTVDATIDLVSKLGNVGKAIGLIAQVAKAAFDVGQQGEQRSSDFARAYGGGIVSQRNVKSTAMSVMQSDRAYELGYRLEEAFTAITETTEALGRTAEKLSTRDVESAMMLKRFGLGGQVIGNFDTFGKSIHDTDNFFAELYNSVSKKGLSFRNVSKAVNDNLRMAQKHTFANGLKGLTEMAEKSVQLKYNMQQVASFSDRVSTLEGALQASARLSVLGGSFAQFGNPMELLYEGLNDMEALNERMINMFGNRAFWDSQRGEISMAPEDRVLLKHAAEAAGLNADEMLNLSYNNARRNKIGTQIGNGVSKETADYIKNIGALDKSGNAYVTINGKEKYVNQLTEEDKEALKVESDKKDAMKNADLGSIYGETMTIGEKLQRILDFIQNKLYVAIYKGFDFLSGGYMAGVNTITDAGEKKRTAIEAAGGTVEQWIQDRLNKYDELADDTDLLKKRYGGLTDRRARINFAKALIGDRSRNYANGYSPDEVDILSNVPGNGTIGGNLHADGGTPVLAERGEFLMNRISSGVYKNELAAMQKLAYNPSVKNTDGHVMNADTVSALGMKKVEPKREQSVEQTPRGGDVSGTIKVDIPQTITINISGAGQIGQYDISNIIKKYVDTFMKEAQIRGNFDGFNKEKFYNQSSVI